MSDAPELAFTNIKFVSFGAPMKTRVTAIDIGSARVSFFYPLFHFGDLRYTWGRQFTYWDTGYTELKEMLELLRGSFRPGSSISVYFSLGFYVGVVPTHGRAIEGIRIERPHVWNSTLAEAQSNTRTLLGALRSLPPDMDTRSSISWASQHIFYAGEWRDSSRFEFLLPIEKSYPATIRKQSVCEETFFNRKLSDLDYCTRITKRYYYDSDAWRLARLDGNTTRDCLSIPLRKPEHERRPGPPRQDGSRARAAPERPR